MDEVEEKKHFITHEIKHVQRARNETVIGDVSDDEESEPVVQMPISNSKMVVRMMSGSDRSTAPDSMPVEEVNIPKIILMAKEEDK